MSVADPKSETFNGMGRMASWIEIPFACGGEDERGWAAQDKTGLILDNLIAERKQSQCWW